MDVRWNYYRTNGSGWLMVNGRTYKAKNMDEAFNMLDRIVTELVEKEEQEIQNDKRPRSGDESK
jgi:hypothetical protein